MNKYKNQLHRPPQTAMNDFAYKMDKKVNKPYLNKTVRGFSGNKESGKKYPLYKSNMLILTKEVVIPKGAFSITVWESTTDFHGNPYKDGVPRADVSIAPLSDADILSLEKSGYKFDAENLQWINKKFMDEKMEGNVDNSQIHKGGGHSDTGHNDSVDNLTNNPQSATNYTYDDEDDDDIPF